MLKFEMYSKELKTILDKVTSAINKKNALPYLSRIYIEVGDDGIVRFLSTDAEQYVEITGESPIRMCSGKIAIDISDIKIFQKMNGLVNVEQISDGEEIKVNIKCGTKTVTINAYDGSEVKLPETDTSKENLLVVDESWMLETISNLLIFTSVDKGNLTAQAFHFNVKENRVEALDGHRVGIRSFANNTAVNIVDDLHSDFMLHNRCASVFKKIMNKNSDGSLLIFYGEKEIRIVGKDFVYMIQNMDKLYFDVDRIMEMEPDWSFTPDRKEILSVMKYDNDLVNTSSKSKELTKPIMLHSEKDQLFVYAKTDRYEVCDLVPTENVKMNKNLYACYNPGYMVDIFNIVDNDYPTCEGLGEKGPLAINGNEYKFLVLPVNPNGNIRNSMKNWLEKNKVA